jgi:hypothetical protein
MNIEKDKFYSTELNRLLIYIREIKDKNNDYILVDIDLVYPKTLEIAQSISDQKIELKNILHWFEVNSQGDKI